MWRCGGKAVGYRFVDPAQEKEVQALTAGIKRVRDAFKARGLELTRAQESWICVVQSLRSDLIPQELNLHGPKWPQDNIGAKNLWMAKPITEKGEKLWAEAVEAAKAASEVKEEPAQPKAAPAEDKSDPKTS